MDTALRSERFSSCLVPLATNALMIGLNIWIESTMRIGLWRVLPLQELPDPTTGRIRVRVVDIDSDYYTSAKQFMICLEKQDLGDPEMLIRLADAAKLPREEFVETYSL